ncbi:MAG TPA: UDP-N-acetyl-D-glucosamine dehydrogenase [Candidatus Taylorbacteria bacterium]|nr:MAG: Nucleotide sugar dehydrogenase [Parcubacteria group bacterium GW2011_GWA2_47_64]KKU96170.1 MAG: Nucleotide sugar dehydrogenase [Parcubacteria group bacterium GW2011_GWC2_48_17]HBV01458.1 UDP-N-acetyl-D-glucosamine dehydrogenase [Candidatus Taylorbacteria bacterium]
MGNQSNKTVSIIGLGYVGLPLALLLGRKGYKVTGVDINSERVESLNKRIAPFADQEITEQLRNASFEATMDFSRIKDVGVIIICVPTPVYANHMPNLEPVQNACKSIASHLQKGQLVILESTVNPGVCESIILPILEKGSELQCGKDFYLAHCPERINPGDKKWNVENIPRVVGGFDEVSLQKAIAFYATIISAEIKPMASLKEAEAVKIVENAFRDINIAFVNELAMSFSRFGIDTVSVLNGAATKPFAFMPHYPGCGVGGHCIPVDPYYLIDYAKKNGFRHEFLSLARRINNDMPRYTIELLEKALKERGLAVIGAKVAVLGLAYKAEVGDCRESPSLEIIKLLEDEYGARVVSFDPFVLDKSTAKTLDEAVKGVDAVIVATAHNVFKKLEPDYFTKNGVKVVIDGRNALLKEKFIESGIIYEGIGR